jgi:hypothetical protein
MQIADGFGQTAVLSFSSFERNPSSIRTCSGLSRPRVRTCSKIADRDATGVSGGSLVVRLIAYVIRNRRS